MLSKLVSLLPPDLIRAIGRLQFRLPLLGHLIGLVGRKLIATEGVIKYGVGAGLKFNAKGGFAGYLLGTSEPLEQETLARLLKPGDVFYDIGANVGFYSTIAARIVGSEGRVYAFEPSHTSAASVRKNAALNGFTDVEVIEAAVGERSGRARFIEGRLPANSNIVPSENGEVTVISVDEYIDSADARAPDLVMIDVEGAEIDVLRGMLRTIREYHPIIMCEIHWILDEFYHFRDTELIPLGYEVTTLTGEPFPTTPKHYHVVMLPS